MLRRQLLMVSAAALVLVGCEIGNPGPADRVAYPAPTMSKTLDDVAYGTEDQQVLDVYAPAVPNGGAILWIHGGSWADTDGAVNSLGSEEQFGMQPVVQAMYRRGWTVFSARYSGTDEAIFPKPLQDLKLAVRWVKAHAADFGVSPSSVVAMGFSAGGHLAGMLAVTSGSFEPAVPQAWAGITSKPAAAISLAGVLDPATFALRYGLPPGNSSGVSALIGCGDTPTRWATCNPALLQQTRLTSFDDSADAPMYIVQGAQDGIVDPVTQGRDPYRALSATMGDDRVWFDLVDTGSPLSYAGLDPQNHTMGLSYELNMTALTDFVGRVLPAVATKPALARYAPLTACRVADSRTASPLVRMGAGSYRLQVTGRCGVPSGASAVVLTVTAVRPAVAGGVRVAATGAAVPAPLIQFAPGEVRATTVVMPLSAKGTIDITGVNGGVLLDVSGTFVPASVARGGRFTSIESTRVLDTAGTPLAARTPVSVVAAGPLVPSNASAAMVAITMSDTAGPGHLSVAPDGAALSPYGLLSSDAPDETRTTYAVVALRNGRFTVSLTTSAEVTIDVVGWYTGASAPVSQQGMFRATRNTYAAS